MVEILKPIEKPTTEDTSSRPKKAEEEATRHRRPWQNLMILNQVLIRRQRDVKDQQRNLPVLWMVMKQVRLLHLKLTYFIEDPSFSLFSVKDQPKNEMAAYRS